jgi:hypothetical protein
MTLIFMKFFNRTLNNETNETWHVLSKRRTGASHASDSFLLSKRRTGASHAFDSFLRWQHSLLSHH